MDVVVYPIVISYDPKEAEYPYFVEIPAVNGFTEGTSLEDAIKMAEDYIGSLSLSGKPMPKSVYSLPKADNGDTVTLVRVDLAKYKREHDNKLVKKTLTIPYYLNELGQEEGINFSAVLTAALKEKLHA